MELALRRTEDAEGIDTSERIRVLEHQLDVAREERLDAIRQSIRWRRCYEALKAVLVASSGPEPELDEVDEAVRHWAALGDRG